MPLLSSDSVPERGRWPKCLPQRELITVCTFWKHSTFYTSKRYFCFLTLTGRTYGATQISMSVFLLRLVSESQRSHFNSTLRSSRRAHQHSTGLSWFKPSCQQAPTLSMMSKTLSHRIFINCRAPVWAEADLQRHVKWPAGNIIVS